VKVDETGGSEDELIAKIIDRLRPTIKEMVAKEKTGEAQNGILTQSRLLLNSFEWLLAG
jgi:hypothetical protein